MSGRDNEQRCKRQSNRKATLTTQVKRLSQNPWAIFASVLADSGAMRRQSAQRRSSICRTGSPTSFQACHSSSLPAKGAKVRLKHTNGPADRHQLQNPAPSQISPFTGTFKAAKSSSLNIFLDASVVMICTSATSARSLANIGTLMAATLPLTPNSILGFLCNAKCADSGSSFAKRLGRLPAKCRLPRHTLHNHSVH